MNTIPFETLTLCGRAQKNSQSQEPKMPNPNNQVMSNYVLHARMYRCIIANAQMVAGGAALIAAVVGGYFYTKR